MDVTDIVDSHVHLWDVDHLPYAWLEDHPPLNRTHDLDAFDRATETVPVDTFVFVECTESFDDDVGRREVEWVTSLAEQDPRIRGIVAHASLEKGDSVRDHLDWLAEQRLVTGVRRLLQDEPAAFFGRSDFREGLRHLARYDFTFDLTIRAPQLPAAIDLVDACPDVVFVLDHIGKPRIRAGEIEAWNDGLAALAERPNVVCKLSGVLTEADPEDWTVDAVRPYIERAVEHFGSERLLFGGDWPVLRLAADYPTWVDVLDTVLEGASAAEKTALFEANAQRVYGLD
ncbi:MAG: amidohydrolase family protein [Salinivenus sp.]